jgi:hypothetical protein
LRHPTEYETDISADNSDVETIGTEVLDVGVIHVDNKTTKSNTDNSIGSP